MQRNDCGVIASFWDGAGLPFAESQGRVSLGGMTRTAIAVACSFLLALPAQAATSIALPDPSGLMLFSLGVVGVIVGRQASRKRPKD